MSSFDQVIRNILADIFAEEEQQEVTRPRARPEGLMSNNKPQNTQEDAEPVQPSASKSTSDFVKAMADYDDTPEEGVEIPLAFFKGTARDIEGRYKATGMQLVKANRDRVNDRIKVPTIEKDPKEEYADDLMAHLNALGIIKTGKKDFIPSTRDIQIMLSDRGYNVGTIDGIMGNKTEAAIRAFQKDVGFTGKDVDGNFGRKTFEAFMNTTPSSSPISQEELEPAPMNFSGTKTQREKIQDILDRDDFIKRDPGFELSTPTITVSSNIKKTKEEKENVQRALLELGYDVGEVDGVIGTKTRAAIRQFQKDNNLSADAVVGKNTAAAMNEALSQASPVQKGTPEVVKAGLFSMPNLGLVTSTPAKLLIKNVLGLDKNQYLGLKPITIDEASFKEDELKHFKNMWNKHGKPEGGYITKEQHMEGQKDILQIATGQDGSPLNLNAAQRAYYSVGDTYMYEDDEGNVILKDMYDYNLYTDYSGEPDSKGKYPILSTEQFEEKYSTAGGLASTASAFATGKIGFMSALHNIGFLLGSRDYKDSSKDEGTPILINLGNPDTWS